uniref:CASAMP N-terminal domain-containing protein n=1 Tax=Cyclopterus lumpus TaxID=8103 RepID=A0A8C3AA47_CYCLU
RPLSANRCAASHERTTVVPIETGMEAQVVPLELYDSARAKIDANLRWLFAKAYGIDDQHREGGVQCQAFFDLQCLQGLAF